MMMRAMPPASAQRALMAVPAPPPMIGLPAATWARSRSRHCSRVKKLIDGSPLPFRWVKVVDGYSHRIDGMDQRSHVAVGERPPAVPPGSVPFHFWGVVG